VAEQASASILHSRKAKNIKVQDTGGIIIKKCIHFFVGEGVYGENRLRRSALF
jgi:hypothetical protein